MTWQYSPFLIPFGISVVVTAALLPVTVRNRHVDGAIPLAGVLTAAAVWSAAVALRIASTDLGSKLLFSGVRTAAASLISVSILFMALEYTDRKRFATAQTAVGLEVFNLFTILLEATNGSHHLVYASASANRLGETVVLTVTYGPVYKLFMMYNYSILLLTVLLFAREFIRQLSVKQYRGQAGAMAGAVLAPWLLNLTYTIGPVPVDLTAVGFSLMGLLIAGALFRYQLFELIPIARGTAVETMNAGYFVLSAEDEIVDLNQVGAEMIRQSRDELIGVPARDAFSAYPGLIEQFADARNTTGQAAVDIGDQVRHLTVTVSPIRHDAGQYMGRVILAYDNTEQTSRQRALEAQKEALTRQNDRLEAFAGTLSHDLRNPLNVSQGYLDLARTSQDAAHFDEIETALDRMDELIEEILTLARQGTAVTDTESLEIEAVATAAWSTVDTAAATLDVTTELRVQADQSLLRQLFENLFRNAVEHGEDSVAVTVGDLDDGFFVADDGPGIPPEDREQVFEQGHTTNENGTGFGLAIVESGVEAHGWSIDVTDSDQGGARFEITGGPTESAVPAASSAELNQ